MIREFLDSWSLFGDTYLSGMLIAVLLSMVGVVVVARDQIFIGAAVAQASTLGIALAMVLGMQDASAPAMAIGFAVAASLLTARRGSGARQSQEAVTGWVFLSSASFSVLLVTRSPHGLEEVHRLIASSLIGAGRPDVWALGAMAAATAAGLIVGHRAILMLVMDEPTAAAIGMRVTVWGYGLAAWLGATLGLSMRSSGMLYTFGCLILPALVAKNLCRQIRPMFVVAPTIGLIGSAVAFVLANHYDWPPAQATIALFGIAAAPAWLWREIRRR